MTNNGSLPSAVAQLEIICGSFSARLAKILPPELRALAFCGPASFREPEIDNIWHPYMLRRSFLFFLWDQLPKMTRALAGGVRRFVLGRFGSYTLRLCPSAEVLGLTPISICTVTPTGVETKYCHPDDALRMSWLVINDFGKETVGYPVSRLKMSKTFLSLLYCWSSISFPLAFYNRDWAVASMITLRWIFSLQWSIQWMLGLKVREVLKNGTFKKVFCVHETHPWSRMVWSEAKQQGVSTITIQHASVSRTKLWYFPMAEELQTGLAMPDEFVVFSQKEQALLKPFFPSATRFYLGCGPRFSQWQTVKVELARQEDPRAPVLFVSSVPWWDNEVVLSGVKKLVEDSKGRPIIVRMHPLAVVPRKWQKWLKKMEQKEVLEISKVSLAEDLRRAVALVGMNTTVLEEGLLMGKTSIVLQSEHYLSFATSLVEPISLGALSWHKIEQSIVESQIVREQLIKSGRDALGLEKPVFRITGANI